MLRYLERGVTLLELVVSLTLLSIVIVTATPFIQSLISKGRQQDLVITYRTAFGFARSQAIFQRHPVTICPLSSQTNRCIDDWRLNAAVFPDANNDKSPDSDIIWRIIKPVNGYTIYSRTGGRGYITFSPTGLTHGASGSLIACPTQAKQTPMSYLAINKGGRFRAQHDSDRDLSMRLSWGATIRCPP